MMKWFAQLKTAGAQGRDLGLGELASNKEAARHATASLSPSALAEILSGTTSLTWMACGHGISILESLSGSAVRLTDEGSLRLGDAAFVTVSPTQLAAKLRQEGAKWEVCLQAPGVDLELVFFGEGTLPDSLMADAAATQSPKLPIDSSRMTDLTPRPTELSACRLEVRTHDEQISVRLGAEGQSPFHIQTSLSPCFFDREGPVCKLAQKHGTKVLYARSSCLQQASIETLSCCRDCPYQVNN